MEIIDDDSRHLTKDDEHHISVWRAEAFTQVKPVKNARVTLYVVAILTIGGILLLSTQLGEDVDKFTFIAIGIASALLFVVLGLLVSKNPKVVLIISLCIYGLLKLVDIAGGASPFSGIIGVIIIGYFLVNGIKASIKFEEARKELQKYGQDFQLNDDL